MSSMKSQIVTPGVLGHESPSSQQRKKHEIGCSPVHETPNAPNRDPSENSLLTKIRGTEKSQTERSPHQWVEILKTKLTANIRRSIHSKYRSQRGCALTSPDG
jgi:hypothetical protein